MVPEKSLLQKIREKELEMSVKIEHIRREADQTIEQAKKEATELIASYEREADTAALNYDRLEKEKTREEKDHLKTLGDTEARAVKEKGEQNLARAVEKILQIVAPE
jgi:vacuolar-type H+-ATPase subunit H